MSGTGDPTRPAPGGRGTAGRLVVLVVLAALLAGGLALERRDPDATGVRVTARRGAGPAVPPADAASSAWYCAAGTASAEGFADEVVYVANLSAEEITATVTVDPGPGADAESERLDLEPYERARVRVSELVVTDSPGVVVEVFGGAALVEHEIRGQGDVAMSPCATEPSRVWHFAAGGTARGAAQTLELYNPFGDDAIVDVTFVTDTGVQEPQALQGFVVGRRSKVRVAVHEVVPRQERVATRVRARSGRVVAEQVRTFDGTEGRSGIALTLGAPAPARRWTVPVAGGSPGASGGVAIANFGLVPTEVEVSVLLSVEGVLAPVTVDVPARSVVAYDAADRVPADAAYAIVVDAPGGGPVVAEALLVAEETATSVGATAGAARWALAGAPERASSAVLAVNVGTEPVTVELRAYTAGDPDGPPSAPAIALAPGEVARFDLDERGIDPGQVLVVSAEGPIVVGRETYAGGVSLALGVPFRT